MDFMEFDEALAMDVCSALAEGTLLVQHCTTAKAPKPGRPRVIDVYRWIEQHPEFAGVYKIARTQQAMSLAEKALLIVDNFVSSSMDATMLKAQSEALRWMAARMDSNTFGDKNNQVEPMQLIVRTSLGTEDENSGVGQNKYEAKVVTLVPEVKAIS